MIKSIVNEKTGQDIKVVPSLDKASLQTIVNEPDMFFSRYWQPKISINEGLSNVIDRYLVGREQ